MNKEGGNVSALRDVEEYECSYCHFVICPSLLESSFTSTASTHLPNIIPLHYFYLFIYCKSILFPPVQRNRIYIRQDVDPLSHASEGVWQAVSTKFKFLGDEIEDSM